MSNKTITVDSTFKQDEDAIWVSRMWDSYNMQRGDIVRDWLELRDYLFATDTTTTSAGNLPWQNTTTTPKLCQIRDNLHSNYVSALFPNDRWLKWEGKSDKDSVLKKARTIEGYMTNKCSETHFRTIVSRLLYDYIDYGNAFATVDFVTLFKEDRKTGDKTVTYSGPRARRISPLDLVFNPLADDFYQTPKIVRSLKTLGDIARMVEEDPEETAWKNFLERRNACAKISAGLSYEDFNKMCAFQADGFGNMQEYFSGDVVEILEFYGDYYDRNTGILHNNRVVTIADRSVVVQNKEYDNWFGIPPIWGVGWRFRQDNLWSMGPLDNLVGMQYRIDHLENLKADAVDLVVHPPLAIIGDVEQFEWAPGAEIHLDEGGSINTLTRDLSSLTMANNEISILESKMELYAGAPREAMGIRTPGEKTALEVQTLNNASGRIFQEKITQFEVEMLEPLLNAMLETSVRNMDATDTVRVLNDELGVEVFRTITKEDITASGLLRPIGARHFAKQAQDMQNLTQLLNTPLGQSALPHLSGKAAYKMISEVSGLDGFKLFSDFIAIAEQKEQASLTNIAQEDFEMEATAPPPAGF